MVDHLNNDACQLIIKVLKLPGKTLVNIVPGKISQQNKDSSDKEVRNMFIEM